MDKLFFYYPEVNQFQSFFVFRSMTYHMRYKLKKENFNNVKNYEFFS